MRVPAVSVAALELRRLRRARLTRIAVIALVLLPLLYAGLYLWSFWDPYGRLRHVPVALVMEDEPAKAGGRTVHAGADLADELKRRRVFDWHTVDAAQARRGVRDGRYYMALIIPRDFSARIAAPSDAHARLDPAVLRLQLDDANNYVVGTLAEAAFEEISAAAGEQAIGRYLDQIFISFGRIHGELEEAAGGAGRLRGGLGEAHSGARRLTTGLDTLHDGTRRLAAGSRQAAAGMQRLTTAVDQAADRYVPLLRENAPRLRSAALLVAEGADAVARGADELPRTARQALREAEAAEAELKRHLDAHPEIPPSVRQELLGAAHQVVQAARQLNDYVQAHAADLREIAADARTVAALAREVADAVPGLTDRIDQARRDIDRLNAGVGQLATGAARIDQGTGQALSGASRLTEGVGTLTGGAGRLAEGLREGAGQVPSYGERERADRSDMMSDPVRLAATKHNAVPNYGTGFAPFFVPLSLWVGAMVIYMVLRPLNPRALASTASARRVALAGWLPAALLAMAQAGAVIAVLRLSLGLQAANRAGLLAFLALTAAVFVAVVQWVNARFGPVGRVVALALLMLQLTSAAGTYPIETSPRFFQVIQPLLPMSWAVRALRHLISGGSMTPVWEASAVLAAFGVGALVLTALAARGNRVWTIKRLHPVLKL
ncbi:YhgE/Pip domain-containing protein [Thermomonospora cellulosilytica]|uniref:Putative membrane protein n=1 Tax=Thermomonospora cellulosilytica TaxID=1411118 RepID=A0A7W3MVQ3_9ACTN|nr:YhgE/Pip domain-containing protein [Thermomonospora cellulosilytica]MBA9002748.1 putative membrane protein [Thermomonospora cellulosilytica]